MIRQNVIPFSHEGAIYAVLAALSVGDTVPPHIFIQDYENGDIPGWLVRERKESGILTVLSLIDPACSFQHHEETYHVGQEVITCPTKTLAGPLYAYAPGCIKVSNLLCDIRQNARQIADRMNAGQAPYAVVTRPQIPRKRRKTQATLWEGGVA